jgi:hypothetical protein
MSVYHEIDNIIEESAIWYQYWIDKYLAESYSDIILFANLLYYCEYYPAIFQIVNVFFITVSNSVHNSDLSGHWE